MSSLGNDRELVALSDLKLQALQVLDHSRSKALVEVVVEDLDQPAEMPELLNGLTCVD